MNANFPPFRFVCLRFSELYRHLRTSRLKQHTKRSEIEPDNYVQITEATIERLEKQCSEVKASCAQSCLIRADVYTIMLKTKKTSHMLQYVVTAHLARPSINICTP